MTISLDDSDDFYSQTIHERGLRNLTTFVKFILFHCPCGRLLMLLTKTSDHCSNSLCICVSHANCLAASWIQSSSPCHAFTVVLTLSLGSKRVRDHGCGVRRLPPSPSEPGLPVLTYVDALLSVVVPLPCCRSCMLGRSSVMVSSLDVDCR